MRRRSTRRGCWARRPRQRAPALPLWSPRVACDEAGRRRRSRHRRGDREASPPTLCRLTRAEDRLYVWGWHGRKAPPDDCWYKLIERGLADAGEAFDFDCMDELGTDGWAGAGRRLANPQTAKPRAEKEAARTAAIESPLPGWAVRAPEPEPSPARPLAPSRPEGDEPTVRPPLTADAGFGFRRGRLSTACSSCRPSCRRMRRLRFFGAARHGLVEARAEIARAASAS
jgi:ATP-dependent helicase/nuclease subunit A